MPVQGTKEQPVYMKMMADRPPPIRSLAFQVAIVVIPVAVAILMQSPALRQRIQMTLLSKTSGMAWKASNGFAHVAVRLDKEYIKAAM